MGTKFAYQPALDGVRAVAVVMVLVFHADPAWLSAGYLGVSVFFTLSGYLITSLAVVEHDTSGTMDVGAFYGRRIRRLLPASLLCLVGVALGARFGLFGEVPHLRRDMWSAVGQVFNWTRLADGSSYDELIAAAAGTVSPVEHYWSLAIEEQFYWVWPLVLVGAIFRLRTHRSRVVAVGGAAAVGIVGGFVVGEVWGPDAAYWATPARLAEILVGALLAFVLHRRPVVDRRWSWVGVGGLAAIVAAAFTWPSGSGPAYTGRLGVFALASGALIVGLQVPSPLRRALAWRPLVALGAISYGVYLFHWPIYAALHEPFGAGPVGTFVIAVALTLVAATLSSWFVEIPIRRWQPDIRPTLAGAVAACLVLAAIVPVVPQAVTFEMAAAAVPDGDVAPTVTRIAVLGDSTGQALSRGMIDWADDHRTRVHVANMASAGCGVLRDGTPRRPVGGPDVQRSCTGFNRETVPDLLRLYRPDVAVVFVTIGDVGDRRWASDEGYLKPQDRRHAAHRCREYDGLVRRLTDAGVEHILWVVPPVPRLFWSPPDAENNESARWAALRGSVADLAARHPGLVTALDIDPWLRLQDDPRPDRMHLDRAVAHRLADEIVMPLAEALDD